MRGRTRTRRLKNRTRTARRRRRRVGMSLADAILWAPFAGLALAFAFGG